MGSLLRRLRRARNSPTSDNGSPSPIRFAPILTQDAFWSDPTEPWSAASHATQSSSGSSPTLNSPRPGLIPVDTSFPTGTQGRVLLERYYTLRADNHGPLPGPTRVHPVLLLLDAHWTLTSMRANALAGTLFADFIREEGHTGRTVQHDFRDLINSVDDLGQQVLLNIEAALVQLRLATVLPQILPEVRDPPVSPTPVSRTRRHSSPPPSRNVRRRPATPPPPLTILEPRPSQVATPSWAQILEDMAAIPNPSPPYLYHPQPNPAPPPQDFLGVGPPPYTPTDDAPIPVPPPFYQHPPARDPLVLHPSYDIPEPSPFDCDSCHGPGHTFLECAYYVCPGCLLAAPEHLPEGCPG